MTEALNLSGPASLELIHLEEPRERAYWAHVLGISENELEAIVGKVGSRAIDVRRHVSRARQAERQRKAHHLPPHVQPDTQAPEGDPFFALVVCCAAAIATMFGAAAYTYSQSPPDEWMAFQRQYGCEAVANTDPTIERLRCNDGRTIVRTKLTAVSATTKPLR